MEGIEKKVLKRMLCVLRGNSRFLAKAFRLVRDLRYDYALVNYGTHPAAFGRSSSQSI